MFGKREITGAWFGLQSLEARQLMSAAPQFVVPLSDQSFNAGGMLSIPIDGSDADGDALTITAISDQAGLSTFIPRGNAFARLTFVESDGVTPIGEIILEIFEQRSPTAALRFIDLATNEVLSGGVLNPNGTPFWSNVVVHRLAHFGDDTPFVLQTGDKTNGNGTGDSPLPNFQGENHEQLTFTGAGMVAFANTNLFTNNSQFFITAVGVNGLDGRHPMAGQMISGQAVYDDIMSRARDGNDRPLDPPLLKEVAIIDSPQDATITFIPTDGFRGTANVTVTLDDGAGNVTEQTVAVSVVDLSNPGHQSILQGQSDTFNVDINAPGSTFTASGEFSNATVNAAGTVTVDTPAGFIGGYRVDIAADTPDSFSDVRADANPIRSVGIFSQDPSDPAGLGYMATRLNESAISVTWDGDLAYVALGTGGIEIHDVSDPSSPFKLGSFDFVSPLARQIAVKDGVAFVATTSGGLVAFDVSNPRAPLILDTLTSPGLAVDLQIVGDTAFIADFNNGLTAIDISDPTNLTVRDTLIELEPGVSSFTGAVGIDIVGNIAYITDQAGGVTNAGFIASVDISDPDNLVFVDRIVGITLPFGITANESIVFAGTSDGFARVNVDLNGNFTGGAITPLTGGVFQLELVGDLLTFSAGDDFFLVDASNPASLSTHYVFSVGDSATRPALSGNLLALPGGESGVFILDTSSLIDLLPPTVTQFTVNQDSNQRSMVTELAYTFSEDVTVDTAALTIENLTTGQAIDPSDMAMAFDPGTNTATWTFPGLTGGSLPDGNFTSTLDPTLVTDAVGLQLDGDGDRLAGDAHTSSLFRLFGDIDGNRAVDAQDLFSFRTAFGTSSTNPSYIAGFDANSDNQIDSVDLFNFRSHFLTTLDPPAAPQVLASVSSPVGSTNSAALQSIESDANHAIELGILALHQQFTGQLNDAKPRDTFTFTVLEPVTFSATLNALTGHADFYLYNSQFELIASSTSHSSTDEHLLAAITDGTYFLQLVRVGNENVDYSLTLAID